MKTTRKLLALVLTLTLVLSMATTAFAAGGTLKITGDAASTTEYTLYKMFDIVKDANGSKLYKVTGEWKDFVNQATVNGVYLSVRVVGGETYINWIKSTSNAADAAALAKLAENYVKDGKASTTSGTVTVNELAVSVSDDGYYLLKHPGAGTSGVLEIADGKNVEKKEKSGGAGSEQGLPYVTKQVKEDSTGTFGEANNADVGETIYFQTTITVGVGASNYILHDIMPTELTYIEVTDVTLKGNKLNDGYNVIQNPGDGCTFHVTFDESILAPLNDNDTIVVNYTAKLNGNAKAGEAYVNETWLTHTSVNVETEHDTATSTTYKLVVKKTGENGKPLAGAKFVLKKGDLYYKLEDGVVSWVDNKANATEYASTLVDGVATLTFYGIDADTYTLVETEAPAGYVQPETGKSIEVKGNDITEVTNVLGQTLPETGGMGTTLFYTVGGIMVLAAVVLLITKKRMAVK